MEKKKQQILTAEECIFYLRFNLKGEVGVKISQFHLVVKQHWVVTVFWRISSLGEYKTEKLKIKNAVKT